jgi:pyrroline-5-carboxylate reductase
VVAVRKGLTPVFPAGSAAQSLFDGLGGSMVLEEERLLDAASTAAATVAAHFSYLRTASGWLAGHGVAPTEADRFIASVFAGVGAELDGVSDLAPLAAAHTTPGGLNERIERSLRDAGVFATLTSSLDDLYASLPSAARVDGAAG